MYSLNSVTDLKDTAIDEDTDDGAITSLTIPATTSAIDYLRNSACLLYTSLLWDRTM